MTAPADARAVAIRETRAVQLRCSEALIEYLNRDNESELAYITLMGHVRDQMAAALDAAVAQERARWAPYSGHVSPCEKLVTYRIAGGEPYSGPCTCGYAALTREVDGG